MPVVPSEHNSLAGQARRLTDAVLDLLFPPRCVACRRMGSLLCGACIAAFEPVGAFVCPVCGEIQAQADLCPRCRAQPRGFESVISPFRFSGTLRQALHALKYEGRRAVAAPLAHALAAAVPAPASGEVLCPVPLHPARERARGFNQSRLLADEMARIWQVSVLYPGGLRRARDTGSQVSLDYAARQANVEGAFEGDPAALSGRCIVLVDDVCTTGATLQACAGALLRAGAARVRAVTLARAV